MQLTLFTIIGITIAIIILLMFLYSKSIEVKNLQLEVSNLKLNYEKLKGAITLEANKLNEDFKTKEIEFLKKEINEISLKEARLKLEEWKIENETFYRQDAINRSASVILGKVTEHAIPFHAQFPFNPKDARFIGSPIDMIVFDGAEAEDVVDVYILEIKTGESKLNKRQRLVKEAILNGRVHWREIRI